ncbi:MAG: nucleotidyltransferase family protein [Anaerolineales bacterium]|nr:nucleotidyltransferase family protein [Anaerolineales bacterium]
MDAVVTAGGIPQPGEPLYDYTRGQSKALLDVAGKPMIQWVLDALSAARSVENVVVMGLGEDTGVSCPKVRAWVPNQGEMLENIRHGVIRVIELNPATRHVLLVSSDIPAITGEMVDWVVDAAMQSDDDVYYNVIERSVMEKRYPGSKRSFTRLKDIEVCGGDMNVVRAKTATGNDAMWSRIIAARKNVFKQAALIGYDTLILLVLRMITLDQAVTTAASRLGITGRAIVCPYAEVGMDVDKPHQLELVREDMARRGQGA